MNRTAAGIDPLPRNAAISNAMCVIYDRTCAALRYGFIAAGVRNGVRARTLSIIAALLFEGGAGICCSSCCEHDGVHIAAGTITLHPSGCPIETFTGLGKRTPQPLHLLRKCVCAGF